MFKQHFILDGLNFNKAAGSDERNKDKPIPQNRNKSLPVNYRIITLVSIWKRPWPSSLSSMLKFLRSIMTDSILHAPLVTCYLPSLKSDLIPSISIENPELWIYLKRSIKFDTNFSVKIIIHLLLTDKEV